MFREGQRIVVIDDKVSNNLLGYLKHYIVDDYSEYFVVLEGVKGFGHSTEWHETRFVALEELVQ